MRFIARHLTALGSCFQPDGPLTMPPPPIGCDKRLTASLATGLYPHPKRSELHLLSFSSCGLSDTLNLKPISRA